MTERADDAAVGVGERHGITLGSWPLGSPPDGAFYRRVAALVDRSGFDLLFAGDHIFTYNSLMESLTLLSHLAAVTERVTLGTGVLLVPLRDPSVLAKQLATIDVLAGGRFVLGAGVGGEMELEWTALGIERSTRGRRMDEYLEILRRLWTDDVVDFDGAFRQVHGVSGTPRPVQPRRTAHLDRRPQRCRAAAGRALRRLVRVRQLAAPHRRVRRQAARSRRW